MAIIGVGGKALLAWARLFKDGVDTSFEAMFEQMLTTVKFL